MGEIINAMSYINKIHFFTNNILNVVLIYMIICVLVSVVFACIRIAVFLIALILEIIIKAVEKIILGKHNEKSLRYNFVVLWFIKFESDVEYFTEWIKYDIVQTYKVISYSVHEETLLIKVKRFSFDNFIQLLKGIINYFIEVSWKNIIILLVIIYCYFKNNFFYITNILKKVLFENQVSVGDVLDIFELAVIICTVLYIILDVRHKTSGYLGLREERFKELIILEEKSLRIMEEMSYSLGKNIDIIYGRKSNILQNGVTDLSNEHCYIDKHEIRFHDDSKYFPIIKNNIFQDLDNMKEIFEKMEQVEEEFKKSSLSYSNIYLVDHTAMLGGIRHFLRLGSDNKRYQKMEFFCKNSMEEWYNNWFVKPTKLDGERILLYDKEQAIQKIYEASSVLDFELQRAFKLEMYLRKYSRKMIKRLKKLNKFSRFRIF